VSAAGGSVLDRVRARGVLRVAVMWTDPPELGPAPEMYLDPVSGQPRGIAPAIGRMLAEDLGVDVEFVDLPWDEQIPALLAGRVDVLPKHTLVPSRALEVEFAAGRWLQIRVTALVRRDGPVRTADDLGRDGLVAAMWPGSSIEPLARRRFPQLRVLGSRRPFAEVADGGADVALVDSVTHRLLELHPDLALLRDPAGEVLVLSREHNKIAVAPGDQRFLNWLDAWYDYRDAQGDVARWCRDWWEPLMADTAPVAGVVPDPSDPE
jgi:ABC-type amino acid transport substrate-binding protein